MEAIKWDDKRTYVEKLSHKDKVRFALYCAKQTIHLTDAPETKECMKITELWLEGKAATEECRAAVRAAATAAATTATAYAAARAAYAAANAAGGARAYAAAHAAYAAGAANAAARANANADIKPMLMEYLYELVYKNEIVEQTLLNT